MLVEFQSVTEALTCAVDFQERMARRNRDMPAARALLFRIGINLGDVIVEDGDIFGDGVNVAARLETMAEPGGICISAAVRDQVGDRLKIGYADLGDQQVKNISKANSGLQGVDRRTGFRGGTRGLRPFTRARGERQKALDRRSAVRQYERRPGAGVFRRRAH